MVRTFILLACAVILTLITASGSPNVAASGAVTSPARCTNFQVKIWSVQSQGAMGHIGFIYRIHNTQAGACTLQGYPGVELLNHQFHSLPTHVTRGGGYMIATSPPQRQVTLDAAHDAYFGLEYEDVPTNNEPCPRAQYLMVTPPNGNLPVVIYSHSGRTMGPVAPCGGKVTVSPVHATETFQ